LDKKIFSVLGLFLILHLPLLYFPNQLVFDENWYVTFAHGYIAGQCFLGDDFHPPLGKVIIALSILIFGDNWDIGGGHLYRFAWSIPSVILGMATLYLFYRVVLKLSKNSRVAFFSTCLLSFDNLFFIHSGIATLDIYFLFFTVLAVDLYLSSKLNLSAVSSGLALASKFFSVFGVLIVCTYTFVEFIRQRFRNLRFTASFFVKYLAVTLTVFLLVLTAFSVIIHRDPESVRYWNPIENIRMMFEGHSSLTTTTENFGIKITSLHLACDPWFWMYNCKPLPYYIGDIYGTLVASSFNLTYYLHLQYLGIYTLPIVLLGFASLPYLAYDFWKNRSQDSLFMLIWFCATYFLYWPLALGTRIMYIFYFLPSVPAICYADVKLLNSVGSAWKKDLVIGSFIGFSVLYFALYLYPVRLVSLVW
jgi:predicted membrane-bound dolichyl-phosphate-mannose-protein mannosyltransferase